MNNIEWNWIIFTDFRIFGKFRICFRKINWKATRVTLLRNLARNPGKNSSKIRRKNAKFDEEIEKKSEIQLFNREKMLTIFGWNFEIEERCKGVHCVDLGESFPTSIYLQKSASIQPRTSPSKFGGKLFNIILNLLFKQILIQWIVARYLSGVLWVCTLATFLQSYFLFSIVPFFSIFFSNRS